MEHEVYVPGSLRVVTHESIVSRRALILRVAGQHGLQADAHALHVMNRRPPSTIQKIETYDAVRVYVRVHRYRMGLVADKDDFGRLDGVALGEHKLQSVCLVFVERICRSVRRCESCAYMTTTLTVIHDPYIHEPLLEVVCLDKSNTRWELILQLYLTLIRLHLQR